MKRFFTNLFTYLAIWVTAFALLVFISLAMSRENPNLLKYIHFLVFGLAVAYSRKHYKKAKRKRLELKEKHTLNQPNNIENLEEQTVSTDVKIEQLKNELNFLEAQDYDQLKQLYQSEEELIEVKKSIKNEIKELSELVSN